VQSLVCALRCWSWCLKQSQGWLVNMASERGLWTWNIGQQFCFNHNGCRLGGWLGMISWKNRWTGRCLHSRKPRLLDC
jgi:hypothetical protein